MRNVYTPKGHILLDGNEVKDGFWNKYAELSLTDFDKSKAKHIPQKHIFVHFALWKMVSTVSPRGNGTQLKRKKTRREENKRTDEKTKFYDVGL